jgi:hypothetical protein
MMPPGIDEQFLNGLSALLSGIAGIVSGSFPSTSRNNPPFQTINLYTFSLKSSTPSWF